MVLTVCCWLTLDPPDWVPDEACNSCIACKAPFTVIRRKHHCRSCGKVCLTNESNESVIKLTDHRLPIFIVNVVADNVYALLFQIFCSRCSSHSAPLPRYGQMKPVRVCTHCYMFHVTPFYTDKAGIWPHREEHGPCTGQLCDRTTQLLYRSANGELTAVTAPAKQDFHVWRLQMKEGRDSAVAWLDLFPFLWKEYWITGKQSVWL